MSQVGRKKSIRRPRKRPIAATIIILLMVGEMLLRLYWVVHYLLDTRLWQLGLPAPLWDKRAPTSAGFDFSTAAFRLLWLLVGFIVVIGLLRMKRWSWVMMILWASISLSIGILNYFYRSLVAFDLSDYLVMAADMVLVFALNQSEIQRLYGIRRDDVETLH
jgi:hypothetical protein